MRARWIEALRKGLEPDPDRRWQSIRELLDVLAYDPRRRRMQWALGSLGLTTVAFAAVGWRAWASAGVVQCSGAAERLAGVWDEERAAEVRSAMLSVDRPYATGVWQRTRQRLDDYAEDWIAAHNRACEATTIRGEQSMQVMDSKMRCLDRLLIDLRATVEELTVSDDQVVQNAHLLTSELPLVARCSDIESIRETVEPPAREEFAAVAGIRSLLAQANTQRKSGRYSEARVALEQARAQSQHLRYAPVQTELMLEEGRFLEAIGEFEEAESRLFEALEAASHQRRWQLVSSIALHLSFVVGYQQRRVREGLGYLRLARGLARGRPELAAEVANNHAALLQLEGEHEEAEAGYRRALELRIEALGPRHPRVAGSLTNIGSALGEQNELAAAAEAHERALRMYEDLLGPQHPDVPVALNGLAVIRGKQGRLDEAAALIRRGLQVLENSVGSQHPASLDLQENLGIVLAMQSKYELAQTMFRQVLSARLSTLDPGHPKVAAARTNLAVVLEKRGMSEEAKLEFERGLEQLMDAYGPDHPETAKARANLAEVLLRLGHDADALAMAERAWTRSRQQDISPGARGAAAFTLAKALSKASRDFARARLLAEEARRAYEEAGPGEVEMLRAVETWLSSHRSE